MGGILAVAARAPQGGRVRKPAAAQQTDPATANQGTCSSTHARLAVATGRNSCPFYDSSELLLSSITSASRAEREAIGAVIRSSGKVTALVDRGLGFSAPRLSTLRLLRHLSSSAYDAAGADATRRALVSAGALETAASLVFLSPTARSGGVADGHTIRQIVYCALALIANLQAAPSCWEPSGCRLAVPRDEQRGGDRRAVLLVDCQPLVMTPSPSSLGSGVSRSSIVTERPPLMRTAGTRRVDTSAASSASRKQAAARPRAPPPRALPGTACKGASRQRAACKGASAASKRRTRMSTMPRRQSW